MASDSLTRRVLPWLLLFAAGALVYGRALWFGFTFYDDVPLLVDHHVRVADPRTAVASFFRDAFALLGPGSRGVFYRPLLWFSYLLDARVGGVRPGVYHASNLLLHLVACGLVNTFLRRLGYDSLLSLGLAALLLVHPALASVVGWIPCRNESLLAIFVVLSALALLRFLERPSPAAAAAVLLGVAGTLFTKESGVALLAVLPALAWVEGRRSPARLRPLLALGAGVGAVALVWLLLRRIALGHVPVAMAPLEEHLRIALVYVGKTLVPVQLSVSPSRLDTSIWPGLVALAALAGLALVLRRSLLGRTGVGLLWYFAFLAPALVVAADTQGLEHRLYVPMIGLLIAAAELALRIPRGARRAVAAGFAALLALAAVATWLRLPDYSSDLHFWESAVRTSPSSESAWRTLAWRQFEHGRLRESESSARRALALRPDEARGHVMLGVALARQGRLAEAESALRRAVALDPDNGDAWQNLAVLEQQTGRAEAAAESQRRADAARARRGG